MNPTFNEKIIAYLALFSGLCLSSVAIYYSVLGLTAIFSAAAIPIIIMGIVLEVSKLIATLWLKQNWNIAPRTIKGYLIAAITVLMLITSMGIFGFLSKAHNDQALVSGDVLAKIAIYDEKIKIAKDNIDANRKALKQLDEAVDQVMARSTTEQGADKAVQVRKQQSKERTRLLQEIQAEQKKITALNEERAPIAAEVRKVEAEVGPLKYIASFIYGETNTTLLEKAVVWVIVILVLVFDPLAVILLLASQISFQHFRERNNQVSETVEQSKETIEGTSPEKESDVVSTATVTEPFPIVIDTSNEEFDLSKHPYLFNVPEHRHPPGVDPVLPQVYKKDIVDKSLAMEEALKLEELPQKPLEVVAKPPVPILQREESKFVRTKVFPRAQSERMLPEFQAAESAQDSSVEDDKMYIQNEEQSESNLWSSTSTTYNAISENEYKRIAREKFEQRVQEHVDLVKSARMSMSDVPEDILSLVKSRV